MSEDDPARGIGASGLPLDTPPTRPAPGGLGAHRRARGRAPCRRAGRRATRSDGRPAPGDRGPARRGCRPARRDFQPAPEDADLRDEIANRRQEAADLREEIAEPARSSCRPAQKRLPRSPRGRHGSRPTPLRSPMRSCGRRTRTLCSRRCAPRRRRKPPSGPPCA